VSVPDRAPRTHVLHADEVLLNDDASPGAEQADVTNCIDKALASAWGAGDRARLSGPWPQGAPQFGNQLKYTPAEHSRTALRAIDRERSAAGTPFEAMSANDLRREARKQR